jgi:hypothetical protein
VKLHVRVLLVFVLAAGIAFDSGTQAFAQIDPLPTWNDGAPKQSIVDFVHATIDQSGRSTFPRRSALRPSTSNSVARGFGRNFANRGHAGTALR